MKTNKRIPLILTAALALSACASAADSATAAAAAETAAEKLFHRTNRQSPGP